MAPLWSAPAPAMVTGPVAAQVAGFAAAKGPFAGLGPVWTVATPCVALRSASVLASPRVRQRQPFSPTQPPPPLCSVQAWAPAKPVRFPATGGSLSYIRAEYPALPRAPLRETNLCAPPAISSFRDRKSVV